MTERAPAYEVLRDPEVAAELPSDVVRDSNMRASSLVNRARYGAEAAAWIERALCPGR